MKKFEYKTEKVTHGDGDRMLNHLGQYGWELVGVAGFAGSKRHHCLLFFKREIIEAPTEQKPS